MKSIGLIPRNRLKRIPSDLRIKHEFCFFLHDECVRMLKEYEERQANVVKLKFKNNKFVTTYEKYCKESNPIEALLKIGLPKIAKKVTINQVTMALTSDCLHHIFEGLKCLEKRKIVVALNILRKPIKDNLLYLSWMLGEENVFYKDFMSGNPERITQKNLGNVRLNIFSKAVKVTKLNHLIVPNTLNEIIYDKKSRVGLEALFQHAVHLITVQNIELRTEPQNFNFIFHDFMDDDMYHHIYDCIPYIFLFMAHVIAGLFNRMKKMDRGSRDSFWVRTVKGYYLVCGDEDDGTELILNDILSFESIFCDSCSAKPKITKFNAMKILLTESFRCTFCKRINPFPFSWLC